jgi:hypothetical protein
LRSYRDRFSLFFRPDRSGSTLSHFEQTQTSSDHSFQSSTTMTPKFPPEPRPVTTNELDAKTKARLRKQANKLSKVFGDVPSLEPWESAKRSQSLALGKKPPPSRVHHTRSSTTVVESMKASPLKAVYSSSANDCPYTPSDDAISPTKLAKFTRLTGVAVPEEPVLRHGERMPLRRARRRKSLDATTFMVPSNSTQELKRSRSLGRTRKSSRTVRECFDLDFRRRYDENFGSGSRLAEQRRAQNVKRARKMTQVSKHVEYSII